mgnify:CR=1 FL=1
MNLSPAARSALINMASNRQGETTAPSTAPEVHAELQRLGLLGAGNGLTRKGTVQRQILLEDMLELAFS